MITKQTIDSLHTIYQYAPLTDQLELETRILLDKVCNFYLQVKQLQKQVKKMEKIWKSETDWEKKIDGLGITHTFKK